MKELLQILAGQVPAIRQVNRTIAKVGRLVRKANKIGRQVEDLGRGRRRK